MPARYSCRRRSVRGQRSAETIVGSRLASDSGTRACVRSTTEMEVAQLSPAGRQGSSFPRPPSDRASVRRCRATVRSQMSYTWSPRRRFPRSKRTGRQGNRVKDCPSWTECSICWKRRTNSSGRHSFCGCRANCCLCRATNPKPRPAFRCESESFVETTGAGRPSAADARRGLWLV